MIFCRHERLHLSQEVNHTFRFTATGVRGSERLRINQDKKTQLFFLKERSQ